MADEINKKITIDVEVNTDGKQQIQQYKAAFDCYAKWHKKISNND
jgi:hypothetical protein